MPVITGIGHERDDTVLDIVAHTRMKTPTAVAEFLISNIAETAMELDEMAHDIVSVVTQRLQDEAVRLSVFETKNTFLLKAWLKEQDAILASAKNVLIRGLQSSHKENQNKLSSFEDILIRESQQLNKESINNLTVLENTLKRVALQKFKDENTLLEMLEKHLLLASPENILKKGYTLTMKDGKVIKQSSALKKGDKLTTVFADGKLDSIVN